MSETIRVSRRQVESARAAVEIAGGLDKVDPLTAKIATAEPAPRSEPNGSTKAS